MKVKLKNPAGFLASNGIHYRSAAGLRNEVVDMPDSLREEVAKCKNCEIVDAPRKASAEDAAAQTSGKKTAGKKGQPAESDEVETGDASDEAKAALNNVLNGK